MNKWGKWTLWFRLRKRHFEAIYGASYMIVMLSLLLQSFDTILDSPLVPLTVMASCFFVSAAIRSSVCATIIGSPIVILIAMYGVFAEWHLDLILATMTPTAIVFCLAVESKWKCETGVNYRFSIWSICVLTLIAAILMSIFRWSIHKERSILTTGLLVNSVILVDSLSHYFRNWISSRPMLSEPQKLDESLELRSPLPSEHSREQSR